MYECLYREHCESQAELGDIARIAEVSLCLLGFYVLGAATLGSV